MFEKYNIKDLFLACINVRYPDNESCDVYYGDTLIKGNPGYQYLTVVRKDGKQYIDLQNKSKKITTIIDSKVTSRTIEYLEPLSKYYTQDGEKIEPFTRRQAIKIAAPYYNEFYNNKSKQLKK